ncbi:MAG: hypothetical protein CVT98_05400 [Bacteroidetes bacterium HGW-Bacteroidetes-15]|nr:MAG: hypothetical protein CVT98_05400 [Bacteroidetes bacterium HGW-Bacteroidetes-15]
MIPDNVLPADNRIQINYRIVVYGNGNPTLINYNISMGESLLNLKFSNIFGYLGQHSTNLDNEQIVIKLFTNSYHGILKFEDPRFHLFVYNSIGMPLRISIDSIIASKTKAPATSMLVTIPGMFNPWDIAFPSMAEYGQTKTSIMSLDKTNSNIKDAVDIVPQEVSAKVSGITNPNGPGGDYNFALDVSKLVVEAKVELPLYGIAQDFVIVDTIDMEIGDIADDIDELTWINFRLNIINSFPVDAWIQLYFLDSTDVLLDSLLSPIDQLIVAATSGPAPDYITTDKKYKQINIRKTNADIKKILDVKKVCIKAIMDTYQNGTQITKFYSFYDLDVRLGVQAQFGFE